jgi:hypothetical protein
MEMHCLTTSKADICLYFSQITLFATSKIGTKAKSPLRRYAAHSCIATRNVWENAQKANERMRQGFK